jgi:hypothetical protein
MNIVSYSRDPIIPKYLKYKTCLMSSKILIGPVKTNELDKLIHWVDLTVKIFPAKKAKKQDVAKHSVNDLQKILAERIRQ